MEEIKKEGWVIGVMALIFAVINRINQNAEINRVFIFGRPEMHWKYYVVTVIALIISFLFFAFLIWIVFELGRWHHPGCMEYIRYFLVYYVIQLIILICIWPGNFKQDELYLTIYAISDMTVCWNQSFFTQVFYIIAFMIFPYVASVTFFQVSIISMLAAGIMKKTAGLLNRKKYIWFFLVPFLLLPVLDSNQFPLRNSMICWFLSFLMVNVYTEYKKNGYIRTGCAYLSVFLSVFLGAWKIEFLYLVPLLIGIVVFSGKQNYLKNFFRVLIFACINYFILTIPNRFFKPDDGYILTTVLTPVSEILVDHQYDYDDGIKKEFEEWLDYLSTDKLRQDENLGFDTPEIYYNESLFSIDRAQRIEKLWSAVKICVHYPKEFLDNRLRVYCWTNGFIPNVINHGSAIQVDVDGKDVYNAHFKYTQLIDPKLKAAVISFLACRTYHNYGQTTFLYPLMYNSTWGIILLIFFGIRYLLKRKLFPAALCGTILCQLIPIFLAAPTIFFMYYMPFYLSSYTLCTVFVLEWLDKRYKKKHSDEVTDEAIKADISENTEGQHAAD